MIAVAKKSRCSVFNNFVLLMSKNKLEIQITAWFNFSTNAPCCNLNKHIYGQFQISMDSNSLKPYFDLIGNKHLGI